MKEDLKEYRDVEEYILDIPKFTKKHKQSETDGFYTFLGRPGERQKIIHVAGTNGKGSVCVYSESMIMATGHTCGLFSSPHLECMRERIRLQKMDIPEEAFVRIFTYVTQQMERYTKNYFPTFFELLFFMAMVYFEETKPEYIILETGMGGRLDATNIVKNKKICIITRIALDHMAYLGDTLEEIAGEKAGIIFGGVPVVYYHEMEDISRVIREKAEEMGAEAIPIAEADLLNLKNHQKYIDFSIFFEYYGYYNIKVPSCALYQCMNVSLALYAMRRILGKQLTQEIAAEAVVRTSWSCRMEEIRPGILLDGAHNPNGMQALLQSLSYRQERKILLFAAVSDKDIAAMVHEITASGIFEHYIITVAGGARAADLDYVEKLFRDNTEKDVKAFQDAGQAFRYGKMVRQDGLLVVAGSLYLAGLIRSLCKD
ncbi:MAG: bifunctional folylpolyglutamate synthase/dihydrofolate synthase [Lachnospiraceae bacterium]|nr:bifunctional folylpolyglutamate synthase/dihydrofolate synthase [Lachnospiraceae bacterium]